MPNHKMTSGISARCGMLRTICNVVSVNLLESCDNPLASPKAKPMPPPMTKPTLARQKLTQILRSSSPDTSSFHPATATSDGAGTALVGDPATVAARIKEYQDVGIDTFIMSGYPHLEEAYRFAELVFPLLSLGQAGNVTPIRVNTGPFGETIGNEYRPQKQASQS